MKFDPRRPLTEHTCFRLLVIIPLAFGVALGIIIWFPMNFSFTLEGYKYFLEVSKLPIGFMGLAIPLGGFYSILHKSIQLSYQAGEADRERERERFKRYYESLDSILVLLYRITNHTDALLKSLTQHSEHTDKRAKLIFDSWSSFYSDARFMPAMLGVTHHFNNIDPVMLGFEQIVHDRIIVNTDCQINYLSSNLSDKLSKLEGVLIKDRENKYNEHLEIMKSINARYGVNSI